MTSHAQNLRGEQKKLVAVGASVGAGCQPCVTYETQSACGCGCGDQHDAASAEMPESAVTAASVAPDCHPMVESFNAMADCREMFERFIGGAAPARAIEPPAPTVAGGPYKLEV
jgi:hypothetical protein